MSLLVEDIKVGKEGRLFFFSSEIVWFYVLCLLQEYRHEASGKVLLEFTPKVNTLVPDVLCPSRWELYTAGILLFCWQVGSNGLCSSRANHRLCVHLGCVLPTWVATLDDIKYRQHSRILHYLLGYVIPASGGSRRWTWGGSVTQTSCFFLRTSSQS